MLFIQKSGRFLSNRNGNNVDRKSLGLKSGYLRKGLRKSIKVFKIMLF